VQAFALHQENVSRHGAKSVAPRADPDGVGGVRIEALNRVQLASSRHLAEAWKAVPHVFQAVEVDFSAIAAARHSAAESFVARTGTKLTYLPFVVRATCLALIQFPRLNATFDGQRLHISDKINLGIAVDLDHQGLVVPIVPDAGGLGVGELAIAIAAQAAKARSGKLTTSDIDGATYTVSNNGGFGALLTTPIINAPQVAVLSFDAVSLRPLVVTEDEAPHVVARPAAFVGQSFDHRAIDGAYSAGFLSRLRTILQTHDWQAEFG
jgi:2-oxoglutarate dehydrogenase E2 component (dihydrolipoamide succinyltransferase)